MKTINGLIALSSIALAFNASTALARRPAQVSPASQGVCRPPQGATFREGVIPDVATASRVSLAILNAIYGQELISMQSPLNITQEKDRYVIVGVRRRGAIGGHATMTLCKSNGAVVYLSHSK